MRKEVSNSPEIHFGELNPYTETVIKSWIVLETARLNEHVDIDRERLLGVAKDHFKDDFEIPDWRAKGIYAEDNLAFISHVLVEDTVNAAHDLKTGEKYAAYLNDGSLVKGSYAMVSRFYEVFGEGVITTEQLDKTFTSVRATKDFFKGVNDIPYPELRYRQLRDYIDILKKRGENPNDILNEVGEFNHYGELTGFRIFNSPNGPGLTDLLIRRFPVAYGQDVQSIGFLRFPFHKRAQLVPLEIQGRIVNSSEEELVKPFVDIGRIGAIADYEVPRSLRALGILNISSSLSERIQNLEEIKEDSREEVEIRAATVVSCMELLEQINKLRAKESLSLIDMTHLDFWLWSQAKVLAGGIRAHQTKTMSY